MHLISLEAMKIYNVPYIKFMLPCIKKDNEQENTNVPLQSSSLMIVISY